MVLVEEGQRVELKWSQLGVSQNAKAIWQIGRDSFSIQEVRAAPQARKNRKFRSCAAIAVEDLRVMSKRTNIECSLREVREEGGQGVHEPK
jgi:hypothetical protein